MEKKTEAIPSPKSSVPKMATPPPSTNSQSKGSINDSTYQGKSGCSQETTSNGSAPKAPCIDQSELTHPIISVDIKKSAPSESKPADHSLESDNKEEANVRKHTEVVASVVTNAVVDEAAMAVSTTNESSVTNGIKLASDHKKVNDRVKAELSRIDETSAVEISDKPMLNGDLSSKNVTPDEMDAKDLSLSDDKAAHISKADSIVSQKEDEKSCNGVAGIIVVESINKKDASDALRVVGTEMDSSLSEQIKGASNVLVLKERKKSDTEASTQTSPKADENPELNQQDETPAEKDGIGESIVKINDSKDQILPDKDDYRPGNDSHKIDVLTRVDKTKTDNVTDAAKLLEVSGDGHVDEGKQNATDCAKLSEKIANDSSSTDADTKAVKSKSNEEQKADNDISGNSSDQIVAESEKISKPNVIGSGVLEDTKLDDSKPEMPNTSDKKSVQEKDESTAGKATTTGPNASVPTAQGTADASVKSSEEPQSDVKTDPSALEETASEASPALSSETSTADAAKQKKETAVTSSGAESGNDSIKSRIIPEDSKSDNGWTKENPTPKDVEDVSKQAAPSENGPELSCSVAALKRSPQTCDVAVGADEVRMVRVASGDGFLEEIDGEQATAEVEVTDDSVPVNAPSPGVTEPTDGQESPTDDRSASPNSTHTVSSTSSKPSSARSSDVTTVEVKPPSAVSRSSIPEAVVYEPPERRKSAVSAMANEAEEAEKNEEDEEKDTKEAVESEKTEEDEIKDNTAEGENEEEKREEQEGDTEAAAEDGEPTGDSATDAAGATEPQSATEATEAAEAEGESATAEAEEGEATAVETDASDQAPESDAKPETEENAQETVAEEAQTEEAVESEEKAETEADAKEEDENAEGAEEVNEEKEVEADVAAVEELDAQSAKEDVETQEPETLVGEGACEKEAAASEDKESEDTEKEGAPSEEKEQGEEEKEQVQEATESSDKQEDIKTEESEPQAETETADDAASQDEKPKDEDEPAKDEDESMEAEAPEEASADKKDDDQAAPESKEEQEEKEKEPSPKSPTKRTRSPDKLGRRGVSPFSSPPKPPKIPTSPQKPQKTPSPKKKNGMLSPIKTPKTPGSDTKKLPPIKAPVGLAPNPNLKNIRSKIGSFDNIRYKPGGGDKKVISKKLEWKAAPKIGSLDYTNYKGNEKKKERSKSESKEAKSPVPSGDEAEVEGATAGTVTDSLPNPDETGTGELPVAIAAES